jgi:acyl-CoA synthetase (AMP-forming)/AMP-acid ligase II
VAIVEALAGSTPPDLAGLQEHCRSHLAGYKVPRAAHVVDAIVRSAAGKADYAWAREIATT